MKNITVTVDDEVYRQARIKAANWDTSVSALVKDFLIHLGADDRDRVARLRREEQQLRETLRAEGHRFRAADRLSREQVHDRHALR